MSEVLGDGPANVFPFPYLLVVLLFSTFPELWFTNFIYLFTEVFL